jgi:bilirubin oxidase
MLSPGERTEILVNYSGMNSQTMFLKSFASELPIGIYGSDSVGDATNEIHEYKDNFLNGADFNLLKINVVAQAGTPVTNIPTALIPYTPFNKLSATNNRTIVLDTIRLLPIDPPNRAEGPFGMNNQTFNMDSVNEVVHLNTTEIWTLVNKTLVAHPFHIHDIQFNVIEKSGLPPAPSEVGWKDVVLVLPGDSVKFITKFETFADNVTPYMFHCHLLHHEDDGMMGSFLVIDTTAITGISVKIKNNFTLFPNPVSNILTINFQDAIKLAEMKVLNVLGEIVLLKQISNTATATLDVGQLTNGLYFIQINTDKNQFTKKIIKI